MLIPRPETELLAEQGWTFLNQRAVANPQGVTALDLGTGSGCLAIALAVKAPAAQVWGTDISPEALAVAGRNAARHHVAERLHFLESDRLAAVPAGTQVDLLISNPPYIPSAEIATLQPEVRDFEPHRALDGGADGLDFYRFLAAEARPFLKPGGKVMVEFGDGQAEHLRALFEQQNWIVESILDDYTQRSRILIALCV